MRVPATVGTRADGLLQKALRPSFGRLWNAAMDRRELQRLPPHGLQRRNPEVLALLQGRHRTNWRKVWPGNYWAASGEAALQPYENAFRPEAGRRKGIEEDHTTAHGRRQPRSSFPIARRSRVHPP